MNHIQLEILPMEHITLDFDDLPADTTDGAFYRDMALDKLLHADEWEDLEGDYNHIPAILKQQAF